MKRENDKVVAAERKAKERNKKRQRKEAHKVAAKLTPIVTANNTTLSQPGTLHLPANVMGMAREAVGNVEETLKMAKLVAGGNYEHEEWNKR